MQIHEVTQPSILGTIGKDIKSAVSAPFQKAAAVMSTPGAMTDPHAYRDAMQKYHAGQVAALEPRVQAKLAGQIAQQTQQRAKQLAQQWAQYVASKPKPPARLKSAPTPIKPTGQYATKPAPGTTINMEPGAVTVREVDEPIKIGDQPIDPKDPKYAQLISKLPRRPATVTAPPTGFSGQNYTQDPDTKQWYKIGTAPPTGGSVKPQDTRSIMTGTRAQEFKDWVNKQLTSPITGTNQQLTLDQVRQADPKTAQKLAQLLPAILMKNDINAVEQYLTMAMQAMQQQAAKIKQANQPTTTRGVAGAPMSQGVLDRYVDPVTVQKLQSLVQNNSTYAAILKKELGIT